MCRGRQPPLHRGPAPRGRGRLCDHLARGGTSASRGALLVAEFPPHRVARSGAHLRLAPHGRVAAPPYRLSCHFTESTRTVSAPLTRGEGWRSWLSRQRRPAIDWRACPKGVAWWNDASP